MAHVLPSTICAVIEKMYPQVVEGGDLKLTWGNEQNIAAVLAMVDSVPRELLLLASDDYAKLVAAREALRTGIRGFEQHGSSASPITKLPGFTTKSPITLIYHALKACPDTLAPRNDGDLDFLADPSFREAVGEDMVQVASALSNAEWKAATVLAGSVVEAVLLDWLLVRDSSQVEQAMKVCKVGNSLSAKRLETWHLADYIDVAVELGLVDDDVASLCTVTRNYRNLIHPGKEKRTEQKCSRETAFAATAAMDAVVRLRRDAGS